MTPVKKETFTKIMLVGSFGLEYVNKLTFVAVDMVLRPEEWDQWSISYCFVIVRPILKEKREGDLPHY